MPGRQFRQCQAHNKEALYTCTDRRMRRKEGWRSLGKVALAPQDIGLGHRIPTGAELLYEHLHRMDLFRAMHAVGLAATFLPRTHRAVFAVLVAGTDLGNSDAEGVHIIRLWISHTTPKSGATTINFLSQLSI